MTVVTKGTGHCRDFREGGQGCPRWKPLISISQWPSYCWACVPRKFWGIRTWTSAVTRLFPLKDCNLISVCGVSKFQAVLVRLRYNYWSLLPLLVILQIEVLWPFYLEQAGVEVVQREVGNVDWGKVLFVMETSPETRGWRAFSIQRPSPEHLKTWRRGSSRNRDHTNSTRESQNSSSSSSW